MNLIWSLGSDKLPKPVKNKAMTMYERLLKKGEEIGMAKGEEIGTNLAIQVLKMYNSQIKPEIIAKKLNVSIEYVQRVIMEFDDIPL